MRYLLDTGILADLIRNPGGKVADALRRVGEDAVCTSVVVAADLRYGAERQNSAILRQRVKDLLSSLPVLPLDIPSGLASGVIRAERELTGHPIDGNALLIAAHARTLGLTLVTANAQSFTGIRGLTVENWLD